MSFTSVANTPQPSLAWQFEGSTTDYLCGLTGTTTGTVTYESAKFNNGIRISNSGGVASNYVSWTTTIPFPIDTGLSIFFWIKFNNLSNLTQIQTFMAGGPSASYIKFQLNTSGLAQFQIQDTVGNKNRNLNTPVQGIWYHYGVVTLQGNVTTYINAVAQTNLAYVQSGASFGNPLRIGAASDFTGFPVVDATWDDIRIYNTALTSTQVQAIYATQGMQNMSVWSGFTNPAYISITGTSLFAQLSSTAKSSAVSAFSLRAINGTTAKAVQVRRSSDNATQDFYADRLGNLFTSINNGVILNTWLNGATGYVTYWYDQSGKNNHASQGTTGQQPIIQRATKGPGYACLFSGSQQLIGMSHSVLTNTNYSFSIVERRNASGGFYPIISSGGVAATDKDFAIAYRNNTTFTHAQWNDDIDVAISGYAGANEPLRYWTGTQSSTNGRIGYYENNQTYNDSTKKNLLLSTSGNFIIGGDIEDVPNYYYYQGEIYEILIFTQSLYDIDGIVTINTIYNNQKSQYGA
jgi:hypothetical protein